MASFPIWISIKQRHDNQVVHIGKTVSGVEVITPPLPQAQTQVRNEEATSWLDNYKDRFDLWGPHLSIALQS
jgi:hypothetical protein